MAIQKTNNSDIAQKFLASKGLGGYAVSAVLGNLYAESGILPTNLQNSYNKKWNVTDEEYIAKVDAGTWADPLTGKPFTNDCGGFGLAQWTSSGRKAGLYNYAKSCGTSIADINMQLNWLWSEFSSSGYKTVMNMLTANASVRSCSDVIVKYYERPANQTDENLAKRASYGEEFYNLYYKSTAVQAAQTASEVKEVSTMMKQSEFLEKLKLAESKKTLYVLGCFGAPMTQKNKTRYKKNNDYNAGRAAMIEAASTDTFGFDCIGLIKGVLWGWVGDTSKTYGGAGYRENGVPDVGANTTMSKYCTSVTTDFTKIQPGWAVWLEGHIGVYMGDGIVVECTPKWKNCVQYSHLGNLPQYKTGNYRVWTKCGKLPWIEYETSAAVSTIVETKTTTAASTATAATSGAVTYTVVKGDTLSKIAAAYHTTVSALVAANGIKNPNSISVGQKLVIPCATSTATTKTATATKPTTYTVVKGDSLSKIAAKNGTTWKALATLNGIKFPYIIKVGQVIKLK